MPVYDENEKQSGTDGGDAKAETKTESKTEQKTEKTGCNVDSTGSGGLAAALVLAMIVGLRRRR